MNRKAHDRILVLTGAGISAESGIRTFRDSDGLWEDHAIEDVATPEGFTKDPALVWSFYRERYNQAKAALPNAGHLALADLEARISSRFNLITQNVDGLHSIAGNKKVFEMHGSLYRAICTVCKTSVSMQSIKPDIALPLCPKCNSLLRPDVVWFHEVPYFISKIETLLKCCDLFLIVGTSGTVYPAAGFVMTAKYFGARTVAINMEAPKNLSVFDEFYQGNAATILPNLLSEIN